MIAFIKEKGVNIVFNEKVFGLEKYRDALKKLEENRLFAKGLIKIPGN